MESNEKKKKSMKLMNSLSRREPTMPAPDNGRLADGGRLDKKISSQNKQPIYHSLGRRRKRDHHPSSTTAATARPTETRHPKTRNGRPAPPPGRRTSRTTQHSSRREVHASHDAVPTRFPATNIRGLSLAALVVRRQSIAPTNGLRGDSVSSPASARRQRRKLLGALEKCDEDLKSLKRIIEAVRVADKSDNVEGDGDESVETVKSVDSVGEQPSPVSVLDPVFSPTCYVGEMRLEKEQQQKSQGVCIQLRAPEASHLCISGDLNESKKHDRQSHSSFFNQIIVHRLPTKPTQRQYYNLLEQFSQTKRLTEVNHHRHPSERKRSQALTESVSEIWENGVLEQTCELGKVVVIVERGIFRELVDEFVREMLGVGFKGLISQWTCRKRLCF
ncbi:uncharacterized protein A4U43_C07F16970 [Asparagus officinalis]|uniref:DUF3741 domain-containing protein n=1 Tax=Asparagus officinalis TaxID=4686 RepID=A0A5P1ECS0_ASPOF|nr:uncharacterized protein LOC109847189 [Asparagus officinalis]ONK63604.1 uncharacterized protein A4U43_C07F16970 [Asparagus officinalis]